MSWRFQLRGDASSSAIGLDIYQPIGNGLFFGGVSAQAVRQLLNQNRSADTIRVRINSDGGDVLQGLAIYQDLVDHPAQVEVTVVGVAASMASIIAMAGDTIAIAPAAYMMIHDPLAFAVGTFGADELRDKADLLDKTRDMLAGIYAKRTGAKLADVLAWMADETWMTPDEAKARGFVDSILTAKEAAAAAATPVQEPGEQQEPLAAFALAACAALNLGDYRHVPTELASRVTAERGRRATPPEPTPPPPAEPNPQAPQRGEETHDMAIPKTVLAALGLAETATDAEAEAAAVRLQQSAAVSTQLATRVATLEAGTQQSGIEAVIARLSTGPHAKLPPSLHAWARTQTVAQLEAWAAGAPPINLTPVPVPGSQAQTRPGASPTVNEPVTQPLTLTAADLEVCQAVGLDPKVYLEERKLELERARLGGRKVA